MPDRLDDLLRATRSDVVEQIKGPDLVRVGARARTLRRRRRSSIAGAFAIVVAIGVAAFVNTGRPQGLPEPATTVSPDPSPSPSRVIWQGAGLTLLGLTAEGATELPGDVRDVQFIDPEHGYALLYDCTHGSPCDASFATTTDGGYSWRERSLPRAVSPDNPPTLVPLGPTQVLLTGRTSYLSSNYGGSWTELTVADPPPARATVPGGTLTVTPGANGDCAGGDVRAWLPDGTLVRLAHQPPIRVCWAAAAKSGDGAWWVGGSTPDGRPAVAASRDDGRTWKATSFDSPAPGAWAKVITVGSEVYATVVTGDARSADTRRGYEPGDLIVRALHRSGDGGNVFVPYGDGHPVTMVGDLVAMLDGRLILATPPKFNVSSVDGTGFKPVPNDLPSLGLIRRTAVGWVAYDLLRSGWTAYTVDGQTWHKITIH